MLKGINEKELKIKLESLWSNPHNINLDAQFLYFITDDNRRKHRYIGKARNKSRLKEYENNMLKIKEGRERGKTQNYRAVHFVMYTALINGWEIDFYPIENCINCTKDDINQLEKQRISEYNCNLNGAKTWRVSQINNISIDSLLR